MGVSSDVVRWGGWSGVVGGVMFVLSTILSLLAPHYLFAIVFVVALTSTLVAIAGLHAVQSRRYGKLGAAGSLITFIGYALIGVVTAVSTLVGGEALYTVRLIAAAAVLIGSILLGATTLRTRVLPWWCGVLLIVGFPLGDVVNNFASGSEAIVLAIIW